MNYEIHTYGCKVNTYDTGLLQKRLERTDLQSNASGDHKSIESGDRNTVGPRVHILNTCAVTAEATKEAVRMVRRLKARDPECRVVVTGCAAQVDTEKFNVPGADLIVANSHKGQIENLIQDMLEGRLQSRVHKDNIFRKLDLEEGGGIEKDHSRAFLKIQDGCNSFCTYCVIPFARGRSRSIPVLNLIRKVNELFEAGAREAVLTGVHIGDYEDPSWPSLNPRGAGLEDLMDALVRETSMPRLRLSSMEPVEVSDRVLAHHSGGRFCPHFHMSIQSANTKVLSEMKRQYGAEHVESALGAIAERVPGAFVGMDVIAGFPGETDAEFEDTYERLARLPWTRLHVFPYSSRPGTKAAVLPGVSGDVIRERAKRLRMLSAERFFEKAQRQVGTSKQVLGLRDGTGLSRDYWPVRLPSESADDGSNGFSTSAEREAEITGANVESGERIWLSARLSKS